MRKKLTWSIVIGLMLVSLLAVSCGQKAPTTGGEEPGGGAVTGLEQPKHGGTITTARSGGYSAWDPGLAATIRVNHMPYTTSKLIQGDWTKGPMGTHETDWQYGYLGDVTLLTGELASSWEMPDSTTIRYHIDKNAHFFKNPGAAANDIVNGRKVTAEDVAWNIRQQFNWPSLWQTVAYPPDEPAKVSDRMLPGSPLRPTSVTAISADTVEVKVPADSQGIMFLEMACNMYTNPPELWEESNGIQTWHDIIGSSAWIMTDFADGSAITYSRNPDYWEVDPLYPGKNYKWPYADTFVELIIPDISTLVTAIRTGKVDLYNPVFGGLGHDQSLNLISQVKDIKYKRRIGLAPILSGDNTKPPLNDIRVRQAMNMAIDKQSWVNDYLSGDGALLSFPYPPVIDWQKYYTPLDQQPPEVQMLFTYDPEKAKQLLTEAGYPEGFKIKAYVSSVSPAPDEVSLLANQLAKVGITLDIQVLDGATYAAMNISNDQDGLWYGGGPGLWAPNEQLSTKKGMSTNKAHLDDSYYANVGKVIARDMVSNPDNYFTTLKDEGVYELSSAWGVFLPAPYGYQFWWPWIKNYEGIGWTGWAGAWQWVKSIWIDEAMKKSMGY